MKSSLKKMRGFVLHKHDPKDKRDLNPCAQLDELAQASQDMQDMRNCYDSLLSAAAATANSAYEFSVSLREMGACLLEKTAMNDDEESGRVLLLLGKVQFELQKLVDSYRSHISKTITTPSESLLNELRTVEIMKRQCDEKRTVYEYMMAAQKEKGKSRGTKGENFSSQQLQTAHDEYDEEATLFVFRLKSLKQGQSRSLLTQAARHHAAQLNLFKKGLKSLEEVEPHVKHVADSQHIDYQFSGLQEDDDDGDDGYDDDGYDDGELSFDYGQNDQLQDVSTSRNSMELDQVDLPFSQGSTVEATQDSLDKIHADLYSNNREPRPGSQSAPIFAEKKFDPAERIRQMRPLSTRKFHTYVLPTPVDSRASTSTSNPVARRDSISNHNLWHSSPLDPKGLQKESISNKASMRLPPPLGEGLSLPQFDARTADSKKIKRQAFSGPLSSKPWSTKPVSSSSSGPIEHHQRVAVASSTSPKVSPCPSPPLISSPKISELHELPKPRGRPSGFVGHSAPLIPRTSQDGCPKMTSPMPNIPSPLPMPPLTISRSFSIPSNSQRARALHVAKMLEDTHNPMRPEEVVSPPLTPLSLANVKTSSSTEIKGT
ncbi:hypothetical protein ACHQM5_010423 [Ranunculus cassubicifolius]